MVGGLCSGWHVPGSDACCCVLQRGGGYLLHHASLITAHMKWWRQFEFTPFLLLAVTQRKPGARIASCPAVELLYSGLQ